MGAWFTTENDWLIVGFAGQALFASRFILQWFRSEMEGRSVIPLSFWYCSVGGGIVLLAYAVYKHDPVFILGQASGLFVYARNLYLIFRERKLLRAAAQGTGAA
ncbi:MAG TPA: lipid-A-disaccharide synthase N-terminal domain-containing protein [Rhizomicrobium sp.]|nr:lipid-A-disaccharide synthase N-terminal domain-containing protein [Rhizomicrobium sp.]